MNDQTWKGDVRGKTATPDNRPVLTMADRVFSEQLHRIRDVHIEVESILQSLSALQSENLCASCTNVCCKEAICRESMDSDFLRFVLGSRVDGYSVSDGWYVPGSGCRLSYGRPLVCYEYFREQFDAQAVSPVRQLSRAFKAVYTHAFAGQHILAVKDISRISEYKLSIIQNRLEKLRKMANAALRRSLGERLGLVTCKRVGEFSRSGMLEQRSTRNYRGFKLPLFDPSGHAQVQAWRDLASYASASPMLTRPQQARPASKTGAGANRRLN
ncbi:MAG: hypothetical protein ACYCZA_07520 [Thiobacillus sp.]